MKQETNNPRSYPLDDPRLTAYVLGELEPQQAAQLESQIQSDPQLAAAVEELRQFTVMLEENLQDSAEPTLTDAQKERVLQGPQPASQPTPLPARYNGYRLLAAIFLLGAVGAVFYAQRSSIFLTDTATFPEETPVLQPVQSPSKKKAIDPLTQNGDQQEPSPHERVSPESSTVLQDRPVEETLESQAFTSPAKQVAPTSPPSNRGPFQANDPRRATARLATGKATTTERRSRPSSYSVLPEVAEAEDLDGDGTGTKTGLDEIASKPAPSEPPSRENYDFIQENPFVVVEDDPLSTFSIDVDTASYANVRRFLLGGQLPPKDAVRLEEMINYFQYEDPLPSDQHPFGVTLETGPAPWQPQHRLVRIGFRARDLDLENRPACNLVFLIDVSGSMNNSRKLGLVKTGLMQLAQTLGPQDRVAIVVYAGASGLVLPSTNDQDQIQAALKRLEAGGSTNGGAGIALAYQVARQHFMPEGSNRVILATDGDFNVGISSRGDLVRLIQKEAQSGVFLSVLGVGMGNYQDATLEQLANKGNGQFAYIDDQEEAYKVLVEESAGTLFTLAKDVKLQVEFNPNEVAAYRLIGYENRVLAHRDFNDDRKDAGELGAGHSVTALYEIVPAGLTQAEPGLDQLKYQSERVATGAAQSGELLTVNIRYKQPDAAHSQRFQKVIRDNFRDLSETSEDYRWAAAVAGFGMALRESQYLNAFSWKELVQLAESGLSHDVRGYRAEMVRLMEIAASLQAQQKER